MTRTTETPKDIVAKAQGLYLTLVGLTETPAEAIQIIKIMHLLLWLNGKSDNVSVDTMLENYVADFKDNLRQNDEGTETLQ